MKIAFFEVCDYEQNYFKENFTNDDLFFTDEPLTQDIEADLSEIEVLSVFIYSKVTAKVLKKMPKLKMIVTRSTGFDHIDMEACRARKIAVANVPSYGENTVAEHTFALILALSRKIVPSAERVKHGSFGLEGLRGMDLTGKTIGIVGTGRIGGMLAKMAYGFGMNILGFDSHKNPALVEDYGVKYVTLEKLLQNSDIISLNLRHTAQTHHLINKESINQIKKGALLVNTARGGLIDTPVLLEALDREILGGVGLDVLEEEASIKEDMQIISKHFPKRHLLVNVANNILIRRPNVIITPHNAFNSDEAFERIMQTTTENISAFCTNKKPINLVTERE